MQKKQPQSDRALLGNLRIALTVAQDDPLSPASTLLEQGATVYHYPVSQSLPPDDIEALDAALLQCKRGEATWLILPSPCAVEAVAARLKARKRAIPNLGDAAIAAFGTTTHLALAKYLPKLSIAQARATTHADLIDALQLTPDDAVIVPIAQRSRADWAELIVRAGASAEAVPAYRLLLGRGGDDVAGQLWAGNVDVALFLTENSVRHFAIRLKAEGGTLDMLDDVVIACFDAATATAARAFGLEPQVVVPSDAIHDPAAYLLQVLASEVIPT